MSDTYTPPEIWETTESGGAFAGINRPFAGARFERDLPQGEHDFQLYSLGTPNGVKVAIMFEELLEAGYSGAEYDAWKIDIGDGDQFGSGFTALNPNGKIPALLDRSGPEAFRVFESGAILQHLAEKFDYLLPKSGAARAEVLSWLNWQMGTAPFIGGGFGHFYEYAPAKFKYAIDRYSMETKRIFSVANNQLEQTRYLAGDELSIADIAAYPWLSALLHGAYSGSDHFLQLHENTHVERWVKEIDARPAAIRGRLVTTKAMPERHFASDFDKVEDRNLFNPVRKRIGS